MAPNRPHGKLLEWMQAQTITGSFPTLPRGRGGRRHGLTTADDGKPRKHGKDAGVIAAKVRSGSAAYPQIRMNRLSSAQFSHQHATASGCHR